MPNWMNVINRDKITLVILCVTFLTSIIACRGTQNTTFDELVSNPRRYNAGIITIEGFYFDSFEFIGLCERLTVLDNGRFAPDGEVIWINSGLPVEVYNRLSSQQAFPDGFVQHYGRIKVTGKFEYGGKYGHLGGFRFQITPENVELLPPPK